MKRAITRGIVLAMGLMLVLGGLVAPLASAETVQSIPELDGMLGGSKTSFNAIYGDPIKTSGSKSTYAAAGFGQIVVNFRSSVAVGISLYADRLTYEPLTDYNKRDWSLDEAINISINYVPGDLSVIDQIDGDTALVITASSATLKKVASRALMDGAGLTGNVGTFSLVYNYDTQQDIYRIDIVMGTDPATKTTKAKTPTTKDAKSEVTTAKASGTKLRCTDFKTQQEAQWYFDAEGGARNPETAPLDGDKDGVACESLPKGSD